MCPVAYFAMIRSKNQRFDLRYHLVQEALKNGIRATARAFRCSVNTVTKWRDRYEAEGLKGLEERSRAPQTHPNRTPLVEEEKVIAQRRRTRGFSARRLKREFELALSVGAIQRIISQNGLSKPRKRKHRVKKNLQAVKATYAPFTHLQMDTKYLRDIPNYWPYMKHLGLPEFQYTVRCVRLGATFLGYANSVSVTYAELLAKALLKHLSSYGIDPKEIDIQTDQGTEFDGTAVKKTGRGYTHTIEKVFGAHHTLYRYNPNANADVESFHAHEETEFFDIESFTSLPDFWEKITTYQNYWNLARPNSYKFNRAPVQILKEADPNLPSKILVFGPLDLEAMLDHSLRKVYHHVPVLPGIAIFLFFLRRGIALNDQGLPHLRRPQCVSRRR